MSSPKPRRFVVQGRIPGEDDDTVTEVVVFGDESPSDRFVETILYGGNIPKDWKYRNPELVENRYGEWAYIQSVVENSCSGRRDSLPAILKCLEMQLIFGPFFG